MVATLARQAAGRVTAAKQHRSRARRRASGGAWLDHSGVILTDARDTAGLLGAGSLELALLAVWHGRGVTVGTQSARRIVETRNTSRCSQEPQMTAAAISKVSQEHTHGYRA